MKPTSAAIVTVGSELVTGLLVDTNTAEISLALARAAILVDEAVSVPDDSDLVSATLARLIANVDLVVVTGGLGPTHDDITRQAAARALGVRTTRDRDIEAGLNQWVKRHGDPRAASQVLSQADVIEGARVLPAVKGTAPGLVVPTPRGSLILLPGPPREMRPMLETLSREWGDESEPPAILRCTGTTESDVQLAAQDVLGGRHDIALTVLAAPGDVRVVLFDRGAGAGTLREVSEQVARAIGRACYSTDGSSLAETVLRLARVRGERLATAESCTGGLVAGALTAVPGASDVYVGGVVAYSDDVKTSLLSVPSDVIARHGAVSEETARAMAEGVLAACGADRSVSVTGVAGPGGGTDDKPVGTVWFAVSGPEGTVAEMRSFPGDREVVRIRSVAVALDLVRRSIEGE